MILASYILLFPNYANGNCIPLALMSGFNTLMSMNE